MTALESLMTNLTCLFIFLVPLALFVVYMFLDPSEDAERGQTQVLEQVYLLRGATPPPTEKELHKMAKAPLRVPVSTAQGDFATDAKNMKRRISHHIHEKMRQRRQMPAIFDDSDDEYRYRLDTDEENSDFEDFHDSVHVDSGPSCTDEQKNEQPDKKRAIETTIAQMMQKRTNSDISNLPAKLILSAKEDSRACFEADTDSESTGSRQATSNKLSSSENKPAINRDRRSSINAHVDEMIRQQAIQQTNWAHIDVPFGSQQSSHEGHRYSGLQYRRLLTSETGYESEAAEAVDGDEDEDENDNENENDKSPEFLSQFPRAKQPERKESDKVYNHDKLTNPYSLASRNCERARKYNGSLDEARAQAQAQAQLQAHSQDLHSEEDFCLSTLPKFRGRLRMTATSLLFQAQGQSQDLAQTQENDRDIEQIERRENATASRSLRSGFREAGWDQGSRLLFAEDPVFKPNDIVSPNVREQINERLEARRQVDETREARRLPELGHCSWSTRDLEGFRMLEPVLKGDSTWQTMIKR